MQIDCSLERIKKHPPLSSAYSDYRLQWELIPQQHITTSFPLHLDIEITNRCNLKCDMCAFHSKDAKFPFEECDMHFSLFKQIIDEGAEKGLKSIKLNYSGEPLLHPHIFDMIKYAKKKGIIDVMFNSNGTLLTNKLITSGLDKIIFSHYDDDKVKQKIISLSLTKKLHGKKTPLIRVQRLVYPGEDRDKVKEKLVNEYGEYADELGIQLFFNYNKPEKSKKKTDFECAYPWQRMLILADGTVLSCCGMPHKSKLIGNANHQSIEVLWHSAYMRFVRDKMENKDSHMIKACVECPMRVKIIE